MQTSTTYSNRGLSQVAERQMRNWALELQTQKRLAEELEALEPPDFIHPYLAISREAGADAGALARAVAARCGWKVLDDELLDYIAEHEHLSRLNGPSHGSMKCSASGLNSTLSRKRNT